MTFRKVASKPESLIASEWDALADIRQQQISQGIDITYNQLLCPAILEIVRYYQPKRILDAGCGVGMLTAALSDVSQNVVGIDPSSRSIELAKKNNKKVVEFHVNTIEGLFLAKRNQSYDAIIANMVLMGTIDLSSFLDTASNLLHKSGRLIFSITHPCFWPEYYGYASENWFKYEDEIIIEGPFRTSLSGPANLISTHVHRPLSSYISKLTTSQFIIERFTEPVPPDDVLKQYPQAWKYPRYIIAVCYKR